MPPASIMADNNMDPFGQFGQLSLDPYAQPAPPPGSNHHPRHPATPPHFSQSSDANTPGRDDTGFQYSNPQQQQQQQQQQQPMQISPEQQHAAACGAPGPQPGPQPGQPQQQQQQAAYPHSPYGFYAPTQQQQTPVPYQLADTGAGTYLSPPVSPLRPLASPGPSPPESGALVLAQNANHNAAPSMPFFDATQAPYADGEGGGGGDGHNPTVVSNPFDVFAAAPAQAPAAAPATVPADPFGAAAAPIAAPPHTPTPERDDADFWNSMGFAVVPPADSAGSTPTGNVTPQSDRSAESLADGGAGGRDAGAPVALDARGLPAGGEYYQARVTTPMLGAIFSSATELRSTLYQTASDAFVAAVGERPVISFTIDGSAADTAGIGLGHVLLRVNGREVQQTDEAVRTVGAATRPMVMDFYVPGAEVRVVKTEGQCMVKYDNHSTEAPASACEWKPKYVVVGDMLGKPYILYMYRSKAEYDVAVKESQTRGRALSVKVKQFDLRGARLFHEGGRVHYPNHPPWHYFTVVGPGMPIKISARTAEDLRPVHEGIRGFLDRDAQVKRARLEQHRERARRSGMHRETYY